MVKKLQKRVNHFGSKAEIIHRDIAAYRIQESFADVCVMYYSFHEVDNKAEADRHIGKAVKMNGLLSIYEPTIEVTRNGMKETADLFKAVGFMEEINWSNLFTRFVRLRKAARA